MPAILSRRLDPRAGVSVVWGVVSSGSAHNVIPSQGMVGGTVRMLDQVAWAEAEVLARQAIEQVVAQYGVTAEVDYRRGVPPVVNDAGSTQLLGAAVARVLGPQGWVPTSQSLGGEDFGWYLAKVPGAMARLGTRSPGGPTYDLHQGNLRVDEASTAVGGTTSGRSCPWRDPFPEGPGHRAITVRPFPTPPRRIWRRGVLGCPRKGARLDPLSTGTSRTSQSSYPQIRRRREEDGPFRSSRRDCCSQLGRMWRPTRRGDHGRAHHVRVVRSAGVVRHG